MLHIKSKKINNDQELIQSDPTVGDFERFVLNSLLLMLTNFAKEAITLCKSLCRTINILLQVYVCTYAILYSCPTRTKHK